jgi:hypothetical protein
MVNKDLFRINRITGYAEVLRSSGWGSLTKSENGRNSRLQSLGEMMDIKDQLKDIPIDKVAESRDRR